MPTREPDPDPDPIATSARKQRQTRRLPADAACGLCGETEPSVLVMVKCPKALLEGHHAAGRYNDPNVIIVLCRNCHTKATNGQLDVGALPPGRAPSLLERLVLALKSLGSFFELLAKTCYLWAAGLTAVVACLDVHAAGWRHFPGMP
jgi:hypothetical protein